MHHRTSTTRRDAILLLGMAGIAPLVARAQTPDSVAAEVQRASGVNAGSYSPPPLTLVSRHLQWTTIEDGIEVAAEAGFPAIAWSVRPGAHIEPANVARELPRIVELTRAAGLSVPMIITQIGSADAPYAESILDTMRSLGISRYRAGSARYDLALPIEPQLDAFQTRLAGLAQLNERYGAKAMVHTHSRGNQIGGSGWDMWLAVRDLDPRYMGINFDVGHVTAKGGDGLLESLRAARSHIHAISLKDFVWRRKLDPDAAEWPWETYFVPPGDGMVNFQAIFAYLAQTSFDGPLEMYYEYEVEIPGEDRPMDMLGRNFGEWELELPRSQFVALLKRDVRFYQEMLRAGGIPA